MIGNHSMFKIIVRSTLIVLIVLIIKKITLQSSFEDIALFTLLFISVAAIQIIPHEYDKSYKEEEEVKMHLNTDQDTQVKSSSKINQKLNECLYFELSKGEIYRICSDVVRSVMYRDGTTEIKQWIKNTRALLPKNSELAQDLDIIEYLVDERKSQVLKVALKEFCINYYNCQKKI